MMQNSDSQKRRLKYAGRAILITMIIVPFIPFMLAIGVSFHYFTTALENNTHASLERIVLDHGGMVDTFLMERKSDLLLIAAMINFDEALNNQYIHNILAHLKARSPAFIDLGLFDEKGLHLSYSGDYALKGKAYQDEVWFNEVMEKGAYISDIFLGYRKIPHFVIAVRRENEGRRWVLRATIDTLFFDQLVSTVHIGKSGEAYILNHQGIAQTGRRSETVPIMAEDPDFKGFSPAFNLQIKNGESLRGDHVKGGKARQDAYVTQAFSQSGRGDNAYVYAVTSVNDGAWLLVVRQEKQDAFAAFYAALYLSIAITLVGGAVIVGLAFYVTQRILRWIETLTHEKESLGNQLIRASQLAEIGEMAAGFAHEINNPLQIIKGEHSLMEMLLGEMIKSEDQFENRSQSTDICFPKDEWRTFVRDTGESLEQVQLQIDRCSEITSAVLKFGRQTEIKHQALFPSKLIPEILKMIRNKAAVNGVEISCRVSEEIPAFMGDAAQFQQVMLNLFNNALDAVVDRHGVSGGSLIISSNCHDEKEIEIQISDNGVGIRPDHIDKIFSPFFTTKAVGKGSGLGLSVCYGIIESFGGTMGVNSEPGEGTTFTISLPAI